ncbi:hypothetical protein OBBRIDRAFT_420513 [Obba rivulosa]|uniref:Uncharacterized protein n=1 Tax=Obba rivulosa TaxID=1052685 RepID=A0A8E2DF11_9APHY|nr:hypothetical protein OBBRIDRAFT_420513 [Obba rivulosa]
MGDMSSAVGACSALRCLRLWFAAWNAQFAQAVLSAASAAELEEVHLELLSFPEDSEDEFYGVRSRMPMYKDMAALLLDHHARGGLKRVGVLIDFRGTAGEGEVPLRNVFVDVFASVHSLGILTMDFSYAE